MSGGGLLEIQPNELKFPFELKKQSSCSMQLTNKTDQYVAFKVKTTNPKKYCVRPNTGVVSPGSTCDVTVTMQAQKEAPPDMQCKDKFLIQSVVAENGATPQDITPEVFNKETSKVIDECKLRVIYVPGNHPSPVHEESEEGTSPRSSMLENGGRTLFDSASRSNDEPVKEKSSEKVKKFRWSKRSNMSTQHDGKSNMNTQHDGKFSELDMISKLTQEKTSAIQQNQKLRQELELLMREKGKHHGGFSFTFLVLVGLLGVLIGYLIKKT
ncbi:vesicle-associated protein 1-3 isoform X3 [Ananas comosus]|uniref:Vesicle-associated protein 1-3 isoform X3 n=1 Tax=Ananas comosus TaxID=4615 RepID=A0A6P5H4Q5_ANACO|nr:vesicle-associated protein 1-3 isoform X3 [Ananas comosus]XP_020112498.1 vesicle-associated protein 1-3 isoform X3 [Ananas comosus]XP_020112500.1 vesicle-associated protein 1-3 isoform X3 [Ananas comosus]